MIECSPYLLLPLRTMAQAEAERAQRRVEQVAGEWLPWDTNAEMYADETETNSPAPVVGGE